jgi:molybdopterin converting factor subunit 1
MRVRVKLFASFREAAGKAESVVDLQPGTTVGQLWDSLVEAQPRLGPLSQSAAFAVNRRYARPNATLSDGDEVAFLPPVSGG